MALSIQPYKGARDFYPEDKRVQKYMFGKLRQVAELFGYEEYDAPILEPLDIYLAKTGEEIVNEQTYVFEDRGGRKVVIRPEMTPSVSRMVAGKRQELAYPLRWYSLPNLWRYERPQRGRLREHWQFNVDIFGVADSSAEVEIITLVDKAFKSFGAKSGDYTIKLNDRKFVNYLLNDYIELDEASAHSVSKLIDRMNKMDRSDFITKLDEILTPEQKKSGSTEKLLAVLEAKSLNELSADLRSNEVLSDLTEILADLKSAGINNVVFDPTVMRGFDYYTGIVFEVNDNHPDNNRSMLGGGRYDGLVGLFGVAPVPTVGLGWGDVTLQNFLELHNLLPDLVSETDLYAILVGNIHAEAQKVVSQLRDAGINVAVDFSGRKIGDQIKMADKKSVDKVIIIGDDEIKSGIFTVKTLKDGKEDKLSLKQIIDYFKS